MRAERRRQAGAEGVRRLDQEVADVALDALRAFTAQAKTPVNALALPRAPSLAEFALAGAGAA